jgi:hypothetical protein
MLQEACPIEMKFQRQIWVFPLKLGYISGVIFRAELEKQHHMKPFIPENHNQPKEGSNLNLEIWCSVCAASATQTEHQNYFSTIFD